MSFLRFLFGVFLPLAVLGEIVRAGEPFFKKGDVIAIVGGEDMVALSEYGYLELLFTRALPDYHLRFRNLAWEGDTVFEQRRDLGFPTWEEQLEKIGATVVLCQFGQMESLAGKEKLPAFIAAYEKLLARFRSGGKRRVVLLAPLVSEAAPAASPEIAAALDDRTKTLTAWTAALRDLAQRNGARYPAEAFDRAWFALLGWKDDTGERTTRSRRELTRDGLHLSGEGHRMLARSVGDELEPRAKELHRLLGTGLARADNVDLHRLLALIIAKNRLWFDYWRVQNWAFLAGDRTNQPSSRDHLDPAKRWFPAERERFLPLVEAKEREIDALAAKLAQP